MFTTFAKTIAFTAAALTLGTAAFADTTAPATARFESYEMAQTVGMDRRQDRRYDRQDCRQDNGLAGNDKRNCKQSERQQHNANG